MKLIDELILDKKIIKFYDGIDFDVIFDHKKEEFLIFFIDSWSESCTQWKRDKKIKSLLYNEELNNLNLDQIDNNFISIYQTSGNTESVYLTIKDKLIKDHKIKYSIKI